MKLVPFEDGLNEKLRDFDYANAYLEDAVTEGNMEEILHAIQDVIEAHGGFGKLSMCVDLHRTSIYKLFSKKGNPQFSSVLEILDALGMSLKPFFKDKKKFLKCAREAAKIAGDKQGAKRS